MKLLTKTILASAMAITVAANATPVKNMEQAQKVTKYRQSVFTLLATNMGPLGAMAKGKMPMDIDKADKYAMRINQLSLMIGDYTRFDTSKFKLKTEALDNIWTEKDKFSGKIEALTKASANLQKVIAGKDEKAIKKAIGKVGGACGSCHDDFKKE